jgi:predicted AlkP superfamily phosphohydrolase/phosphomutase
MSRMMLIGLDSGDADLIDRWCNEGYLPTLQTLRQQGTWRWLKTTAEVMHVSAWPSLYSGTTPGQHGMYHAYQIRAGDQDAHRTRADECARPPFWKFLDDAGKQCIILDAFMNYPLRDFGGIQILEYGTWTYFSEPFASPDGIWNEMIAKFGPYPAPEHTKVLGMPESREFHRQLIAGAKVKSKVVRWLMSEKPWDMFFVTFGEPHPAGHYLWHQEDTSFPTHPQSAIPGLENAVRDVYVAVDSAIGEILSELDDSVTVMVTSGDGMGPNYAGCHLVPEVLNRLDLYYAAGVGQAGGAKSAKKSLVSSVRDLIPLGVRRAVSRCLPRNINHRLTVKWASENIDWSRTKAFCIPNANEGYIRLNLKGREPNGLVDQGRAYAEMLAELKERMQELVNPQNGQIAAEQVVCIDDVFPGEQRRHLPDLVVNWNIESKVLNELASEKCGLVRSKNAGYQTAPYYTGNHRPSAFTLTRGPIVRQGDALKGGHIIDVAPTILAMLGVELPPHMNGRIWDEFAGARFGEPRAVSSSGEDKL